MLAHQHLSDCLTLCICIQNHIRHRNLPPCYISRSDTLCIENMDEKVEEDVDAVTTAQHGKRPRLLSYNSPATSDLFYPYFNDVICEEKVTDSLMSPRVSSPETNELFEATVSEDGDLSPNTSEVFDVTFEDLERDQEQVHGFEPLPSEHDDIGCSPLADSDNEDDRMTSKLPRICCDSLMKAFLND